MIKNIIVTIIFISFGGLLTYLIINGPIKKEEKIVEQNTTKEKPHEKRVVPKPLEPLQAPKPLKAIKPIEPPKAITFKENEKLLDRSIKFSKRMPPNYDPNKMEKIKEERKKKSLVLGKEQDGRISAYLKGDHKTSEEVKNLLTTAGFIILGEYDINSEKTIKSIVFTSDEILSACNKKERGFAGTLRVLINNEDKSLTIANPIYMLKGFLQDDFQENTANNVLTKITSNFTGLKNSEDVLKYNIVSNYHFMTGMPYYEDMIEVGSGSNLLSKIKKEDIVFSQKLENGSMLIGINLSNLSDFTKIIGRDNAGMLPYPILIEGNKAKILDPKYYIAFMYPTLSMSNFMAIKDIPDDITRECKTLFQ